MLVASVGFLASFVLIFLRVPIAIALALTGFVGFGYLIGWNQSGVMLALVTKESTITYGLVVIPLFILMGNLVAGAGISGDLYKAAQAWIGHRRGGLASATVVSCGGFAAVCGSSVATVVTIGKVALPSMKHYNYSDRLSTAAVAAGATLGIIIPPSIMLVMYGIITETHIGMLYAAGLIPGILGIFFYIGAVKWTVWRHPESAPAAERASREERWSSLLGIWHICVLFFFVVGGIYAGLFTAAEAAGVGAFGALLLALAQRRLTWVKLHDILVDSASTSAMLFAMLIGAAVFTEFLNYTGAHEGLLAVLNNSGLPPFGVILLICLIYIILGALMEELSMLLLTVPLFFPVVVGLGYDPIWFGALVVVLCELGMIAPPIGVNLFVVRSISPTVPLIEIVKGIGPFVVADIARILLIALFPAIALFLPNLLF